MQGLQLKLAEVYYPSYLRFKLLQCVGGEMRIIRRCDVTQRVTSWLRIRVSNPFTSIIYGLSIDNEYYVTGMGNAFTVLIEMYSVTSLNLKLCVLNANAVETQPYKTGSILVATEVGVSLKMA